ncbi:MAG: type II secretion system F family protein [Proteobacteria bacterium]|nr:type II secretion system F family protein [Pseudomonadota bacterium]
MAIVHPRTLTAGTPRAGASPARAAPVDEESFCQDVSLMLQSGLTLLEALKTLKERTPSRRAAPVERLLRRLEEGESLSQAMQGVGGFRPALMASVRSSELTGDLADSLQRYGRNAARLRVLRSRLVSALVYPALLIAVAALVVLFLLVYVVPRFAVVLEGSRQDLPTLSKLLILVGRTLHGVPPAGWAIVALLAAAALARLVQLVREQRLEAALAQLAAHVPLARDLVRTFAHSQLTRSASMLVRSGVPVLKAMGMCRELLLARERAGLDRALAAASAGAPLAAALHAQGIVDALGLRVLRVSEQTGQLDVALDRLADLHDHELERAIERAGRLIEPVLMLGIGLAVGGIVVLMYLPIFQLAASVG